MKGYARGQSACYAYVPEKVGDRNSKLDQSFVPRAGICIMVQSSVLWYKACTMVQSFVLWYRVCTVVQIFELLDKVCTVVQKFELLQSFGPYVKHLNRVS
jgi:hypothetical protein